MLYPPASSSDPVTHDVVCAQSAYRVHAAIIDTYLSVVGMNVPSRSLVRPLGLGTAAVAVHSCTAVQL